MNAFIEERIREMPEQYLWTHRRFKTRPGRAGYYRLTPALDVRVLPREQSSTSSG